MIRGAHGVESPCSAFRASSKKQARKTPANAAFARPALNDVTFSARLVPTPHPAGDAAPCRSTPAAGCLSEYGSFPAAPHDSPAISPRFPYAGFRRFFRPCAAASRFSAYDFPPSRRCSRLLRALPFAAGSFGFASVHPLFPAVPPPGSSLPRGRPRLTVRLELSLPLVNNEGTSPRPKSGFPLLRFPAVSHQSTNFIAEERNIFPPRQPSLSTARRPNKHEKHGDLVTHVSPWRGMIKFRIAEAK